MVAPRKIWLCYRDALRWRPWAIGSTQDWSISRRRSKPDRSNRLGLSPGRVHRFRCKWVVDGLVVELPSAFSCVRPMREELHQFACIVFIGRLGGCWGCCCSPCPSSGPWRGLSVTSLGMRDSCRTHHSVAFADRASFRRKSSALIAGNDRDLARGKSHALAELIMVRRGHF